MTGRGAYRVRVVQINPGPETASASLTGTDSIIGEQIEEYDDRDEFTLAWPVGGLASITLSTSLSSADPLSSWDPLRLHLTSLAGDTLQIVSLSFGHGSVESGPFSLPAGDYRVRIISIDGSGMPGSFKGPYAAYFHLLSGASVEQE